MAKIPFNVDAYTARLIGRENVSKLEGAVVELVKNTYDADATYCILYYDEKTDVLYLADNESGMTEDIIKNHWMTIGRSSKKENFVSQKGRIQTGEKGIGRFALDRIADSCQMLTCTDGGHSRLLWTVDWDSFSNGKNITEIGADLDKTDINFIHFLDGCTNSNVIKLIKKKWKTSGTIFKLTNLRDDWNSELIHTIRENLASLIPYELSAIYKIYCFGNEDTEETAEVFSDLESFSYDYKIEFEVSKQFEVDTKLWRNEYNFGRDEDSILKKAGLIEEKEYFHNTPINKTYKFDEIVPKVSKKEKEALGIFKGIFYFAKKSQTKRDKERFYQKDITGRIDIRDTFGGIKLYRDNFRVRPYGDPKTSAYDWLQLARRKAGSPAGVASKGIWRVNADQMVGSIFISRINIALPDQSNREGIVETTEFRLLQEFLKGILEILEKDRQYVFRKLADLYAKEYPVKKIQEEINRKAEKQEEINRKAKIHGNIAVSGEQEAETEQTVSALAAKQILDEKDEQIVELKDEIKMLRALATTGIVTNEYIHEFKTLSHHLSLKIVMAKEALEKDKDMEAACAYINQANKIREGFNSWFQVTIESIKQDKRCRKKTDIIKIISEATESWNKTLRSKHIEIIFRGDPQQKLFMRCFPYEIDTILSNLISNSTASFEKVKTPEKKIYIDVKEENENIRIDYSDTGAGLDAIYKNNPEKTLEVFETDKRNASGEKIGTGMGLWIVNNTVQEYGGKIDLSRNMAEKTGYYITIFLKKMGDNE